MRVYTDGGYRGEIGGWGWWNQDTKKTNYGHAYDTTNQRMELQAAIDAMETYIDDVDLTIVSDSAYLINCASNGWYVRWLKNGWRNVKGEPVANQDQWARIAQLIDMNPEIRFEKVKGHSGDEGNDMADKMATKGILKEQMRRASPPANPFNKMPKAAPFQLKPHQREAVGKMMNGCVLDGGVGTGKTFTSLAYFVERVCGGRLDREAPVLKKTTLVVITTAKKRDDLDWEEEASHLGIFADPAVSYTGGELIVDSWNNMKKYEDLENAFFIFDEQRLVGKGAWVKTFLKIVKNNEWVLLSATPADTWMDYVPLFLAHGFYKNRTEFMDNHVIWKMVNGRYPQVKGFFGVRQLRAYRDAILVEMPYDRHTTRHLVTIEVEHDKDKFMKVWKDRWNVYTEEPLLDSGEMHRIGRKVVNSDEDRLRKIEELGQKHPRMIIFYNFDYELEMLRTLHASMDIKVAEWNGHRHEPVPDDERWIYLVQYNAGAEGWNCTSTDCIVFYSLTYSHKIFEQSQGRIDRLDTPFTDLWYYILMSQARVEKMIWKALQGKRDFHEGRKVRFAQPPERMAA